MITQIKLYHGFLVENHLEASYICARLPPLLSCEEAPSINSGSLHTARSPEGKSPGGVSEARTQARSGGTMSGWRNVDKRFIIGYASALRPWMLSGGPMLFVFVSVFHTRHLRENVIIYTIQNCSPIRFEHDNWLILGSPVESKTQKYHGAGRRTAEWRGGAG